LSSENFNHILDGIFTELANKKTNPPALFASGLPEHQYEGKHALKPGDVYVEAGAFWGRNGLVASYRVGPTGRVILIEPSEYNIQKIKEVISFYDLRNVELVNAAVWNQDGIIDFLAEGNPAGHRKAEESDRINYPNSLTTIQAYTLDTLLQNMAVDKVDLLCCDVEGAEYALVQGADKYLTNHKILNIALCVYHHPEMPQKVLSFVTNKGYTAFYSGVIPQYGGIVYGHI
jgi:FkbM family methyltransferase